jgi:hypothetical protein
MFLNSALLRYIDRHLAILRISRCIFREFSEARYRESVISMVRLSTMLNTEIVLKFDLEQVNVNVSHIRWNHPQNQDSVPILVPIPIPMPEPISMAINTNTNTRTNTNTDQYQYLTIPILTDTNTTNT